VFDYRISIQQNSTISELRRAQTGALLSRASILWGMQRTFGKSDRYYLDFAAGPQYMVIADQPDENGPIVLRSLAYAWQYSIIPHVRFRLGIRLN
jgi:hypothetical protein